MSEAAYTILDPGGKRWAQLLDQTVPVKRLVPLLCERLDLPEKLQYQLTYQAEERTLKASETLAAARIPAGSELQLSPVRNALLRKLLDKLYEEARDDVLDELWDRAAEKWHEIRRLDESYPDRLALERRIELRQSGAAPAVVATRGPVVSGQAPGMAPANPAAQPIPAGTKSGGSGCATLFKLLLVLGGLVVVGGVVVVVGLVVLGVIAAASFTDPGPSLPPPNPGGGRVEPALGTGDVQVTLRWDSAADVDLHVIDPFGEEIWYDHSSAASGGRLDVDANNTCAADAPVENVFWPSGGGPAGVYQVGVVYFFACGESGPLNYDVTVRIDGRVVGTVSGTLYDVGESHFIGEYVR